MRLLLAILLLALPTLAQESTAQKRKDKSNAVAKNAVSQQEPEPNKNPVASGKNESGSPPLHQTPDSKRAEAPVQPDKWGTYPDWAMVGITAAGLLFGALSLRTLIQQTRHVGGQLKQMEDSGEQTDQMIAAMQDSAKGAHANAAAAQANAEAAKTSLEMLISKERARVRVEVERFTPDKGSLFALHRVSFKVFSYGSTPAFIIDAGVNVEITPSETPPEPLLNGPLNLTAVLAPTTEPIEARALCFSNLNMESINTRSEFIHFFGFIKYRDVFDRARETRFRYRGK